MPFVHSVGVSIPGFRATNPYVKDLVLTNSKRFWRSDLHRLEQLIDEFHAKSGADTRVWRDANSLPKDHIHEAVTQCMSEAPASATDGLSSVIFCGIDRGFVEPAHASALASQIGLNQVRAFDVADACLGWFTACQAATGFASQQKPYSLILSAEFPLDDPGMVVPEAFTIRSKAEFEWKAAALTLGEIATVTLIDAYRGIGRHVLRSENQHHGLCVVPIKKPRRFIDWDQDHDLLERECFIANSSRLARAGYRPGFKVMEEYIRSYGAPDLIIPHAFSTLIPYQVAKKSGQVDKLYNVFPRVGNVSTSSIPFGLWAACQNRDLRNLKTVGWIASAGMKHAVFEVLWKPL